ncbi:calmodulin-binding transcription activator 1 [Leptidea sinapis]|uniref:calmodulin-binding transcription activator 1 n=1 Tax=Leptidea sinapis TaxID=189913 RepID=UPI0021C2EAFA|nr:calmodulin-binding transcription activator 1 [Leptidea sinapis]
MLLYSRKKVRYRRDGYCWKKRKDGKTTREDHMKLKVQGTECIYGCYVHSAILPTFHRRCYWLLQVNNPDIVLVHYLNVPYPDDNKLATVAPSLALWADKKEWTKDELVSQLKPMFFSEDEHDLNNELEISGKMFQTAETVEAIVGQLMEKQRAARAAALARQLECGCPDSTCQDSRNCTHALRRIQTSKPPASDHHVSSTTGPSPRPMAHPPRQYTRDHRTTTQSSPLLLSLGQIQGGGGLLILNGTSNGTQQHSSLVSPLSVTSFVCEEPRDRYRQQYKPTFVLKREIPDTQATSCITNTETVFKVENQVEEKVNVESFDRKIKMEPRTRSHIIASAPVTPSRYPDLIERLESKLHTDHCDDTLVLLGTDAHLESSSGFFDETLELSHEDIQKTLSANMPTCELDRSVVRTSETSNVMVSGIDTMDFIESCEAVASPTHVVDDNVFVNLDAFDMLGDFPELEVLDPSSISTNPVTICSNSSPVNDSNEKMQTDCNSEGAMNIIDYSPEWAYAEGGVKVLVAGPWTETSDQYTVLFDNFPVPSILIQNGLLRCYCPAHEAGLAALQVARGGRVVSDTVVFEYKPGPVPAPTAAASAPLPSLDFRRFCLLQRLQRLHGRLQLKIEPADDNQVEDAQLYTNPKFEDRLVTYCQTLSNRSAGTSEGFTTEPSEDSCTVLHLAAALGYTRLTTALLRWRHDDNSLALEKEVNLGARDGDNCTPLMVASAAGHTETAVVLARWSAGTRREAGARAAAAAARRAGHNKLAAMLDRIHPPTGDTVFRRPYSLLQKGRTGSLESNLVKRPSIDSGINMADAFRSNSAIDRSDSSSLRWERSMSLPLDSDNSEDSLGDIKSGRRMDLALYKPRIIYTKREDRSKEKIHGAYFVYFTISRPDL